MGIYWENTTGIRQGGVLHGNSKRNIEEEGGGDPDQGGLLRWNAVASNPSHGSPPLYLPQGCYYLGLGSQSVKIVEVTSLTYPVPALESVRKAKLIYLFIYKKIKNKKYFLI